MKNFVKPKKRNYLEFIKTKNVSLLFDTKKEYDAKKVNNSRNFKRITINDVLYYKRILFGGTSSGKKLYTVISNDMQQIYNELLNRKRKRTVMVDNFIPDNCVVLKKIKKDILLKILEKYERKSLSIKKIYEKYKIEDPDFAEKQCSIKNYLVKVMKFAYKSPIIKTVRINNDDHIEMKKLFLEKKVDILNARALVFYVDESSFNNSSKKLKKWTNILNNKIINFNGRIPSINLIFCVSTECYFKNNGKRYNKFSEHLINRL